MSALNEQKIKIIAVTGPTASGKTALAIELAKRLGGEIISCDSMQIYRTMDIGTAKPTKDELAEVPHHLIDVLPPDAPYSCSDYVKDAERAVEDIVSRGKLPIFCGGTGLYLDRFLRGGNDDGAACDDNLRDELKRFVDENGADALYERLVELDPEAAATIHKNNVKRVMRAVEICLVTGQKKSEIDKKNSEIVDKYDHKVITLAFQNRDLLYDRIERRVDLMIEHGLLDETKLLMDEGVFERSQTAAQAIGYKELLPYLRGEDSLENCVEELKKATRRYAKRQTTWFSGKDYAHKVYVDDGNSLKTFEDIVNISIKLF
ncbi:MAG: tRNA (adenosine(37)-N6)-dimethylallyltransferase MiaA [Ruminococcaceae bacterium]|nr:tRNA (adenosine(37)-N6)-dimethylallyltransferase MiaA [Oscillospiraceae bacterium]